MARQAEIRIFKIHFASYKSLLYEPLIEKLFSARVQDPELPNIFRVLATRQEIAEFKKAVNKTGVKFSDYCKVTELKQ